ncbi:MAG: DUF3102 domain-containing protein [Syntrophales bacterium]|nr:DUF3102 domain-containing protein [Syntrophales bacterium]
MSSFGKGAGIDERAKKMNLQINQADRISGIIQLHERVTGHIKNALTDAIRIGKLLAEVKTELPHGEFEKWVCDNLPFTSRTARNYMRLHRERDRLKSETVSALTGAYRLLTDTRELPVPAPFDPDNLGSGLVLSGAPGQFAWVVPSVAAGFLYYAWLEGDVCAVVGGEKPIHKDALMDALGDELRRWGDVRPLPLTPDHPWAGPWTFNKILYDDIQTKALQKGLNDLDESLPTAEQIRIVNKIVDRAQALQTTAAVKHLRTQIQLGRMLREIEADRPGFDEFNSFCKAWGKIFQAYDQNPVGVLNELEKAGASQELMEWAFSERDQITAFPQKYAGIQAIL